MLQNIIQKLNFKDKLVEDIDETTRISFINNLSKSKEEILNAEFNRMVIEIQKNFIRLNNEIDIRISKDINELELYELDEYKDGIEKMIRETLSNKRKDILKQLSNIQIDLE